MGRPSKLTPTQWDEVGKRLAAGATAASLAREYGVSETSLSKRFSQFPKAKVEKLGRELAELPPQAQQAAVSLADDLRSISANLAAAGRYGSDTASRLHKLANLEVKKIPDDDLMAHIETLKGVAAFTRTANEAAATGLALLNANRDQGKPVNAPVPLALDGSDVHG